MFVPSGRPARRGLTAALVLAALALLAGCGPSNAIGIQYKGYSIQPSRNTAKAGEVVFNISNQDGQVMHQLLVVRTDTPAGALRLGADTKADLSGMAVVAQADQVDLGQSARLAASLAPGHYVLLCNIIGHYQLGMHADFTVTP